MFRGLAVSLCLAAGFGAQRAEAEHVMHKGNGWVEDARTGALIENFGVGSVDAGAGMRGGWGDFEAPGIGFGYLVCYQACRPHYVTGRTYVTVQGRRTFGVMTSPHQGITCVQAEGSSLRYCFGALGDHDP
jgi:hypothetical protein